MINKLDDIELDIVDFKTAEELYNKGCYLNTKYCFDAFNEHKFISNLCYDTKFYPAPELELVSKWLMEKKDINITICLLRKELNSVWYYNIDNISVDKILHRWNPNIRTYLKYEDALLAAIKHSLIFL